MSELVYLQLTDKQFKQLVALLRSQVDVNNRKRSAEALQLLLALLAGWGQPE